MSSVMAPHVVSIPIGACPYSFAATGPGFMGVLKADQIYAIAHFKDKQGNYMGYFVAPHDFAQMLSIVTEMVGATDFFCLQSFSGLAIKCGLTRAGKQAKFLYGTCVTVCTSRDMVTTVVSMQPHPQRHAYRMIGPIEDFLCSAWWDIQHI